MIIAAARMAKRSLGRGWCLFVPMLAGASLRDRLLACVGALIGVAMTGLVCSFAGVGSLAPLLVAPIGASAVLLFAVPASPLAQPWAIAGGNVISALVGVTVAHLGLSPLIAGGVAVAGAILAMSLARCLHPPGGAVALTAVLGGPAAMTAGWAFSLVPVGINSLALVLLGIAYHRWSGHSYPHRPVAVVGHTPPAVGNLIHAEDLDLALADLGETFDVAREDLELLFRQMAFHASRRRRA